jgi:hypothetical protein
MYEHLVEYCGASEHVRNNRGQTPLLLAASLGKLEMFQVREWVQAGLGRQAMLSCTQSGKKVDKDYGNSAAAPNLLLPTLVNHTCLQHIYNRRRKVAWAYGPVTSYSLSLYEIDTVQSSSRNFVPSTVETIVRKV